MDPRALDWDHVHIMINHFPVILAVMGTLVALMGLLRSRRGVWLYASASLALAGLTAIPSYFSGRAAEDVLRRAWYIGRGAIHAHEEAALIATIATVVAGLVAAIAWRRLVRYPREVSLPRTLRAAMIVTGLVSAAAIGYASLLGGRITHDAPGLMTRPAAPQPAAPAPPSGG